MTATTATQSGLCAQTEAPSGCQCCGGHLPTSVTPACGWGAAHHERDTGGMLARYGGYDKIDWEAWDRAMAEATAIVMGET
jgi:hypothetical protein